MSKQKEVSKLQQLRRQNLKEKEEELQYAKKHCNNCGQELTEEELSLESMLCGVCINENLSDFIDF